jgi:hypothetical protein
MGLPYKVLFRIPFTVYFLSFHKELKLFVLTRKQFNHEDGCYYWREV